MTRIRIGVIGTGFGVRVQIPGFQESGAFDVVAVCSHSERRAREVAERFGIAHAVTSAEALLALPDVVAVSVAATPDRHEALVVAALAAGKHVLCEKPLARDLDEARRMAQAAAAAAQRGLVAMIDHEFRWQPERRLVKELLDQGFVGTPYGVTAVSHMGLFADPELPAWSWWQQRARGAGWLLNSGTHLIDTLRWWLGDVARVAGFTSTNVKQRRRRDGEWADVDADDAFGALLRFHCGADAVLHQSAVAVAGRTNLVEITGSEGVLLIDDRSRVLGARRGEGEPRPLPVPAHLLDGAPRDFRAPEAGASAADATAALRAMELPPFVCLARELAAAIRDGRTREPSIVDAARTQEVCAAIERSAHDGRWLDLPL